MTGGSTSDPTSSDLLDCAREAALRAGHHALDNHARRTEVAQSFKHDVKLLLDLECQHVAETAIRERYPTHLFVGEETATDETTAAPEAFEWIIDPIDGTVNFSHGLRRWCTSIAVRQNGATLAGVVFVPMLNELYAAAVDGPALCNDEPIRASKTDRIEHAMVYTGMDRQTNTGSPDYTVFGAIADRAQKARLMGAAAVDICHVAAGRGDGYFESGIYLWDVAAAGLILRRAGGQTEVLKQTQGYGMQFLASNGKIHDALRTVILDAMKIAD